MIEVSISSSVRPTKRMEKVVTAIENILPGPIMYIWANGIDAYNGADALKNRKMRFCLSVGPEQHQITNFQVSLHPGP